MDRLDRKMQDRREKVQANSKNLFPIRCLISRLHHHQLIAIVVITIIISKIFFIMKKDHAEMHAAPWIFSIAVVVLL